jgi:AmmeMemoRadiSam system protein A
MSPLGADEQRLLLRVARAAVTAVVWGRDSPPLPEDLPPSLCGPAGAFASLHVADDLRGCIGYVEPRWPLADTVARVAASAATHDRRFQPLRPEELPELRIELSVLGHPAPLAADAIEIGVHGLILECAGRSGLLLPQVPLHYGWDGETFLRHLCLKASLPPDAWRDPRAQLLGFTAQVFAEEA